MMLSAYAEIETKQPLFKLSSSLKIWKLMSQRDTKEKKLMINEQKMARENGKVLMGAMNKVKFDYGTLQLPESKGVRSRVLREVMKFLSTPDTLKCALVSKEWLEISRCDEVWKSHFKRDFQIQKPQTENKESEIKRRIPIQISLSDNTNLMRDNFLKEYKFKGESPIFSEYFTVANEILTINSKKFVLPPKIPRRVVIILLIYILPI